jgi:acetylornithine deacetylase/succinyl-diaminopimelate desuccinylase-like protein
VPVTELFQRILGLDAVMLGLGLPDDDIHSPDEHFRLDQLHRGSEASAAFLEAIAGDGRQQTEGGSL